MSETKKLLTSSLILLIMMGGVFVFALYTAPWTIPFLATSTTPAQTMTIPCAKSAPIPSEAINDPALCNPIFANLLQQHGPAWEKDLTPNMHRWLDWQRKIGTHALITGFGVGNPNFAYANPQFVISVTEWDGSDLFELGLPRVFEEKPVTVIRLGFGTMLMELEPAPPPQH